MTCPQHSGRKPDGSQLLTPSIEPHSSSTDLKVIGRILSHGYLCTGFLPTRVALPSLMGMLLGPGVEVGEKVYIGAFHDYLSEVDRYTTNQALTVTGSIFADSLKEQLIEIMSRFNCRQVPTPGTLIKTLVQVSKYLTNDCYFRDKFWYSNIAQAILVINDDRYFCLIPVYVCVSFASGTNIL